jgi:hypothetical protein
LDATWRPGHPRASIASSRTSNSHPFSPYPSSSVGCNCCCNTGRPSMSSVDACRSGQLRFLTSSRKAYIALVRILRRGRSRDQRRLPIAVLIRPGSFGLRCA